MPSEPRDLGVFNITSNSVIIAWAPPAVTNGLSRYIIYMNNLQTNSISSSNTRYQVSGLIPERSYSFHVVGSNQQNAISPPSNRVNIFTPTEGELQPLHLSVWRKGGGSDIKVYKSDLKDTIHVIEVVINFISCFH